MITPTQEYPALAATLGLPNIFLKREDLHPYGSHKGRSIPPMIKHYLDRGDRSFAISSSGNAALAAALFFGEIKDDPKIFGSNEKGKLSLDIFVGNNINKEKLKKIKEAEEKAGHNVRLLAKERPLQALSQAIEEGSRSLRQSTDDQALVGYETLAQEIAELGNVGAVFIGTSSGTTAQALAQYFKDKKLRIQTHLVQTSSCHPISADFETYDGPDEQSIADAIVDSVARRRTKLLPLIKDCSGYSWVATNEEIERAVELCKTHANLDISTNSALSLVGATQAAYRGWEIQGKIVCLVCGQ
ncbi:MAG: PLP-dependent lyase/thiolase [Candidatus Paceibacterota bacterium]